MSFTEIGYEHKVVRVDLDGGSLAEITPIPVPRSVELLRIPAQPAPLDEVLELLAALDLPDAPLEKHPYLQARVLLNGPEPGLRTRIESVLDGKPVRLVKIDPSYRDDANSDTSSGPQSLDDLERLQPEDIFKKLHRSSKYGGEPSAELLAAFNELLLESRRESEP